MTHTTSKISGGLAFVCAAAFAQGGAAVITLEMPPPGADGYQVLQSGGAFPTGAASLYYNPALLAELRAATGSALHLSRSSQELLPTLNLDDLNQNFTGIAATLPLASDKLELGVGMFRNHVNFGESLNDSTDYDASETVYGFGAGLRIFGPVSVGATAKFYDSRLAADTRASGWAFDFGVLARRRFEPLALAGLRSVRATPSLGYSWVNFGPDAAYGNGSSDPLPRGERASLGLQVGALDVFEAAWGWDWEKATHRGTSREDPAIRTSGRTWALLFFRRSDGTLDDPSGQRLETHVADRAVEFSALQAWRAWNRIRNGDFRSSSAAMEAGYPLRTVFVFGVPWRMNPRLSLGRREIRSSDGGIRDGQKASYWSVAL